MQRPVELRIHGVSGTSPESLLDRPLVEQVAGDATAGFYRPRLAAERTDAAPNVFAPAQPDAPLLEGYNWGGLTSGSPGRAFWLLLLPFTLVNIAPRARPAGTPASGLVARLIWYLSRLLALALTGLFVLAAAGVGEDIFGWQCAQTAVCSKAQPHWIFVKPLGSWPGGIREHGWSAQHVLFLGSLLPAVLLLILWFVSKRTVDRYESVHSHPTPPDEDADDVEIGFKSKWMWRNEFQVRRLRAAHMQFGFALILWTLIAPTERSWSLNRFNDPHGWGSFFPIVWLELRTHLMALAPAAIVLYVIVVLFMKTYTGRRASANWQVMSYIVWACLIAMAIVETVGLEWHSHWVKSAYLAQSATGITSRGLPGYSSTLLGVFLMTLLILLAIFVVVWIAARRPAPQDPDVARPLSQAMRRMPTTGLASMGVSFAAVFSAGAFTFAATWLHTGSLKPGFADISRIYSVFSIPDVLRDATLAYSYSVAFLVVVVIVGGTRFCAGLGVIPFVRATSSQVIDDALAHDYGTTIAPEDEDRAKSIKRAIFLAGMTDRAPVILGILIVAGTLIAGFFSVILFAHNVLSATWSNGVAHALIPATIPQNHPFWKPVTLQGTGAYLAVMTILGVMAVGYAAFKAAPTRRVVGILWDVASFWPRAAHPLAAPCYAERTVPDVVTRISWYRQQNIDVVLAGHSQGSIISAAALFHLESYDDDGCMLSGIGLLTFGAVLRRIYGRFFPVYFGAPELVRLQRLLTSVPTRSSYRIQVNETSARWRNLWRYTDYLGGQLTAGPPSNVPSVYAPAVGGGELITQPPVIGPEDWEWHSPDPALLPRLPGSTQYTKILRHSDFWADASGYFQLAVHSLVTQIQEKR